MQNRERTNIILVYAILAASLLLSCIPEIWAALAALLLFTGAWLAAYVVRGHAAPDSLSANHMTFIIRTVWIASGLAVLTMSAATAYVLSVYDPSPLLACAGTIPADPALVEAALKPCIAPFIAANAACFIRGGIIGIAPPAAYFLYRLSKGLLRIGKPGGTVDIKTWL